MIFLISPAHPPPPKKMWQKLDKSMSRCMDGWEGTIYYNMIWKFPTLKLRMGWKINVKLAKPVCSEAPLMFVILKKCASPL